MKREMISSIPTASLTLPNPKRDHIQGPIDAEIALLEYGDYECPFCGEVYPVVKAIQQRLGESLCFAFRNFPLANMHPHSARAAEAAEAAGAQGRFWEMHDILFENQDALEAEKAEDAFHEQRNRAMRVANTLPDPTALLVIDEGDRLKVCGTSLTMGASGWF